MNNDSSPDFRSGFVTFVGRPNTGKSTLINTLMKRKVAITSSTSQTTRHRFRAVIDGEGYQLVLVDTPGIHKPKDALGEELNRSAVKALEDVDIIAFFVDASKPFGKGDAWVAKLVEDSNTPVVLVISKSDLATCATIDAQILAASSALSVKDVVVLSALKEENVDSFVDTVCTYLPVGPRWFPEGTGVDQPLEVIIAEFIREKVLISTFDEVPHAIGVLVDELSYDAKRNFYGIAATIYVERDSQKGILIGKRGEMIKMIGCTAREDLERFLSACVYLDVHVKVRKGWRRDATQIRRFGYGEGA